MQDRKGKYYLGRQVDPASGKASTDELLYDPEDLTTHAVVVGMTGSGKTGLCIGLLEEAALGGVPALMIDPKGDIVNALLHFPNMTPQDFQPWVNADQARREHKTVEQLAAETAEVWRKGLQDWGIGPERLLALQNSVKFSVFTPGSDAGIPISILASLKAPSIPWQENREVLREKISGTVTALLGLVGVEDIDPVRSREHILLSNIFENAWSQGKDLDLSELILQTQNPPFARLGVFDVNTFFPEKDRFELAMTLNNILASPAFQSWIEGQPLDIQALLYTEEGRPRHSIFYIAHLSDAERMFFVTLLYASVETWMRAQSGATSLRALVYFDEIFGYMPPISNPPSKSLMLRMLKQARAFGVGQVLVTQNPVDLDYKGLSNAGSWFIGKLQTDQDKQRLLDGLEAAMPGGLDREAYSRMIAGLGKRVFLLHNVHERKPALFQTRWVMNYLAGPLARVQIPMLNALMGVSRTAAPTSSRPTFTPHPDATPAPKPTAGWPAATPDPSAPPLDSFQAIPITAAESAGQPGRAEATSAAEPGLLSRPAVPGGVHEYFLPNNLTFSEALKASNKVLPPEAASSGLVYRPVILGQAQARFYNPRYRLDTSLSKAVLVLNPDRRGIVRWENFVCNTVPVDLLDPSPVTSARFTPLGVPFSDAKAMTALQKDFLDWAYRNSQVTVRHNPTLKLYAGPEVSAADFRRQCTEEARDARDADLRKQTSTLDRKLATLQDRLKREQRELDENESELSSRKLEEFGTHAENILNLFGRNRRRISSSLTKRRMTQQAKDDVESSRDTIQELTKQIKELEEERTQIEQEINERWGQIAAEVDEIPVNPLKKDVLLDLFGLAWMPFHVVMVGPEVIELAGFKA
jgi:hypothetical protein